MPPENTKHEENYRIILEETSEGVLTTDVQGKITYINKAGAAILGYDDPRELIGTPIVDRYTHPQDRDVLLAELNSNSRIPNKEVTFKKKDGTSIEVLGHVTAKRDENGNITGTIGLFTDITERKRIEEELRLQSEVTSHLSEGIYLIRASDVVIVYTNPRFEQMFGYRPGEMIGKHASIVNAPTDMDPEKTAAEITEVIRKTGVWRGEIENVRKDGTPFWCYASVSLFDHPQYGQVMVAVHTDITERRRIEQKLKERTDFLDTIIESSALSMWISDDKGIAIRANAACLKFFGATKEEVIGKYNLLKDAVIRKQGFMPVIKAVFEKGEPTSIMIDYDFGAVDHVDVKDATHKIIKSVFTPVLGDNGKVSNVIVQSIDLTDIKQAEEILKQQHSTLSSINESIDGFIFSLDRQYRYTSFNAAHAKLMKSLYGAEIKIGNSMLDYQTVKEDREKAKREADKALAGEQTVVENYSGEEKRSRLYFEISNNPIRMEDGQVIGVVVFARDVTERKRAEEQLKQYSEHLKDMVEERTRELTEAHEKLIRSEKLSILGQFASGIAHDLRSPLNAINNAAYILKLDPSNKSERDLRSIKILVEEVKRANNIIEGLLDFYKTTETEIQEIDISKPIKEYIDRTSFAENVNVMVELDKPIKASVDQRQIMRVFQNLIDNAIEAMPKGGTLIIRSTNKEDFIEIEFVDTGTGILPENMDKIFEPLFTTRRLTGGTGIGLAICKSVVEAHSGTISASSNAGEGTTFTVNLPIATS